MLPSPYSAMPALFISHGSPMLALEDAPTTQFLRGLAAQIPKPSAILIASAHWETLAPHARENHPTPEHFPPFFVALAAGGASPQIKHLHEYTALGVLAMDAYAFGEMK